MDILTHGLHATGFALTVNRATVGVFFAFSGYHKLFNRGRHKALVRTLQADGVPLVRLNQWLVPVTELVAGAAVVVGAFTPVAALLLLCICTVATCVDGVARIRFWKPVDFCDWVDCLLYLPEVLLAIMLIVIIGAGPGWLALT